MIGGRFELKIGLKKLDEDTDSNGAKTMTNLLETLLRLSKLVVGMENVSIGLHLNKSSLLYLEILFVNG